MRRLGFLRLALALAVVIHVDWHLALPKHYPFGLGWSGVALLAIVIAQGLVPVLEVAVSEQRLGYPTDPVRWSGFFVCIGVGLPALFAAARLCRPRTGAVRSPSAA